MRSHGINVRIGNSFSEDHVALSLRFHRGPSLSVFFALLH